jgi:TPR repeat protein
MMKKLTSVASHASSESPFELGMMYATGRSRPLDLVSAHTWFNVAATSGNEKAVRMRQEIATEMSAAQITTAQRAARMHLAKLFNNQPVGSPATAAA